CALDPRHLGKDLRLLLRRRPEEHVEIRRRRTVHPRDLHVAAERDRTDPVLDPLPPHLHERGREADVEPARTHPDYARDEEVSRLVQQDQNGQPDDGDGHVHAGARLLSASARAPASASTRSSRSRGGAPSTAASVSSTTSAMPRNGSRPSRNAATAISFAAL